MSRIVKTNLIDIPWPLNLLQCFKKTDAMKPGDELIITLKDADVKDNLVLLFKAIPRISYAVDRSAQGYVIHVTKGRPDHGTNLKR